MNNVSIEPHDDVALVRLNRGVTNAIDPEFIGELATAIDQVRHDAGVHGVVLASSSDKFFSIGWDIPSLLGLDRSSFRRFYRAFSEACLTLYTLPKPIVAAITGHAIAGGCILPLCCDYRYIAEGRVLMGLNEIKLGVPIPYVADCVLRSNVGTRSARDLTELGEFHPPRALADLGIIDRITPPEHTEADSIERARQLGNMPQQAFRTIKEDRTHLVAARVLEHQDQQEQRFLDCWFSDDARARLEAAVSKF